MKFKFYDILSHLIPGFNILFFVLYIFDFTYESTYLVPATACAFLVGFFNSTLSSWLEDFYFFTWGGKPSSNLINCKHIWKVRFYFGKEVKALLSSETKNQNPSDDELFSIAVLYATPASNSRVEDFNANYAFSRAILTAVIVISCIAIIRFYDNLYVYPLVLLAIIIAWLRCKQRAYYFSREVLKTYIKRKKEEG